MGEWHKDFCRNVKNSTYSEEEYQQFRTLLDSGFSELNNTLTALQNSDDELDKERYWEYQDILTDWNGYVQRLNKRKETLLGYPVNLPKRSFLVDFFRVMESFQVYQNNVGDINKISDIEIEEDLSDKKTGLNYAMDVKSLEWDIVRLIADNLGLPEQPRLVTLALNPEAYKDGYWGYVTSGGSESNLWGIRQGFMTYPQGVMYFCEAAHYSIYKEAKEYEHQVISQKSIDDEAIDTTILIASIKDNWLNHKKPAIIIFTFGTTKYGSVDDIAFVKKHLRELQIPHYIHIDAALLGGIPKNQDCAPKVGYYEEWGYDSICVSLHKYLGYPATKGVLISVRKPVAQFIEYIGQDDNTVLGSRDVPAFSLRQQVHEVLRYSNPQEYIKNIRTFTDMLNSEKINFEQWSDGDCKGNIFVFKVNNNAPEYHRICKHWQLCEFVGKDNLYRVHVIIFPYHTYEKLKMLVNDLIKIQKDIG